jgi:hypothetical protein
MANIKNKKRNKKIEKIKKSDEKFSVEGWILAWIEKL